MKSFITITVWMIINLLSKATYAQNFYNTWYYNYDLVWEAGIGAGIMNSLTDLGGRKGTGAKFLKDLNWRSSRPCIDLYIGATYKDVITVRLNWQSGYIGGADSLLKHADPDPAGRYGRNLSFRSSIKEFSLMAETHPLFWSLDPLDKVPAFSPYLTAGIGYFHFNPQASIGEHWHDLHPLRLEGQGFSAAEKRKPYRLNQFCLPLGLGIRYETGPLLNLRLECVYRKLFTDYLDDVSTTYIDPAGFAEYLDPVQAAIARELYYRSDDRQAGTPPVPGSQRGNQKNNDAYFSFQMIFTYVFRNKVK